MLEEREVITLILGLCAVIFFGVGWVKLQLIPRFGLLLASFGALLAGWVFTIVEIYWAGEIMNVLEHGSYALSSALLAWWCAVVALGRRPASARLEVARGEAGWDQVGTPPGPVEGSAPLDEGRKAGAQ